MRAPAGGACAPGDTRLDLVSTGPSLYRRHRPRTFADVVGQEPVVRTLQNAVEQGKVHHAYLFVGSRGTGKTSMAKILAACLNCENGPTTNPCGTCESCVSIAGATSLDVIEMDAASNNSVDDIRELPRCPGHARAAGHLRRDPEDRTERRARGTRGRRRRAAVRRRRRDPRSRPRAGPQGGGPAGRVRPRSRPGSARSRGARPGA